MQHKQQHYIFIKKESIDFKALHSSEHQLCVLLKQRRRRHGRSMDKANAKTITSLTSLYNENSIKK